MQAAQVKGYEVNKTLYMAMELSNSQWKLGFGNGAKIRRKSIDARDRCLEPAQRAIACECSFDHYELEL